MYDATNCDGGATHHSIRVYHSGTTCTYGTGHTYPNGDGHAFAAHPNLPTVRPECANKPSPLLEQPCVNGHHCGMGVVTGDKSACECAPLHPADFVLPAASAAANL